MRRLGPVGIVGIALFALGLAVFVYGIVDVTSDAPSGSISRKGTGTPWLIFVGVGCWIAGMVLVIVGSGRARSR